MLEVFTDALLDSLKIFPFLFLIYLIMEIIESKRNAQKMQKLLGGKFAPIYGSVAGVVPECGFSAMYAKLYENGLIRMGTLLAIFISVSDEGIIIMLTNGTPVYYTLILVGIKIIYGAAIGMLINAIYRTEQLNSPAPDSCPECGEKPESKWERFFFHPLLHSLKIYVFVLIVNFAFGALVFYIGETAITNFLSANAAFQPLVAALIGLIPNCSASVLLAQSFRVGAITFAGLAAGLCANAGIGLALIFRNRKRIKSNLAILGLLYFFSVILGYAVMPFGAF